MRSARLLSTKMISLRLNMSSLPKTVMKATTSSSSRDSAVKTRYNLSLIQVPIIEVDEGETLGEWLGICKYDKKKSVTKRRKCSSVAIRGFSAEVKEEEKAIFKAKLG